MKRFSTFSAALLICLAAVPQGLWSYGGSVPTGIPGNFGIGTIDKNDNWGTYPTDPTAPHRWKMGQSCFDYSYQYLTTGWRTWSSPDGQWPVNELTLWEGQGQYQVFTFYYNNGAASLPTSWFGDLMVLMQKIQANSTKKVIIHFEPDFLGFCVRDKGGVSGAATATGIVTVGGGAAPAGWTGTGAQAWNATNYPNNLIGWAKAIKDMRDLVAPNKVLIAHHFTHWGYSSGSVGDVFANPANQTDVNNVVDGITNTFLKNGIGQGSTAYMDLFFADPADRDAGWWNAHNGGDNSRWNAESYTLTWGTRSWATLGYVVDRVSTNLGKRGMMWQVPNGNHYYKTCNNSDGHWQDNYTHTFLPSTSANGSSGTPGDALAAADTTKGPGWWANKGIIGVLFGEGYYGSTVPSTGDNVTHLRDWQMGGITNPATFTNRGGPGAQGQATSTVSDDEGGYIRNATAKYCAVKFPLPGAAVPTATPTTCVCSPTPTPTRTPLPADCPTVFNDFETVGLTDNGTIAGGNATRTRNTAVAAAITSGTSSLKAAITTAATWNDQIFQVTGFAPTNWSAYKRLTLDFYVDPAALPWSGASTYHKLNLSADAAGASLYEKKIAVADVDLVAGMNTVSFTLDWTLIPAGSTLTKIYLILSEDGQQAGTVYFDNIVLHTDALCPTATASPTIVVGSPTSTPTPTRTPADCPLVLNGGETLAENGTWSPTSGTAAVSNTQVWVGSNAIKFTVTNPASFQDKVSRLVGMTPSNWSSYDRITFDVYFDAANPVWSGASAYSQMQLRVTNSSASQYEVDPTGATAPAVTTGWNHLSFPLSWATYNGNGITELFLIPSVGTAQAGGIYYIDNIVLHTDAVCPPPTATSTVTPTVTRTVTPSATPSATKTVTLTGTQTSTNTATGTPTQSRTASPTPSATPSATPLANTATNTPSATPSASKTVTSTSTPTVTPSATRTVTQTATQSSTPSANSPTSTPSVTQTGTRSATPSSTPSATPSASKTVTATNTPLANTATSTASATPSGTKTISTTASPTVTSPPPGSTATATPTVSGTWSATPSATRSATVSATRTATISATLTHTGTPSVTTAPSGTSTQTHTPGPSATSSSTQSPGPSPTASPTATPSLTKTATQTATLTQSPVNTATFTATPTATLTISPTFTDVPPGSTLTATPTASPSWTASPASSSTFTSTATPTATPTNLVAAATATRTGTPQVPVIVATVTAPAGTVTHVTISGSNFIVSGPNASLVLLNGSQAQNIVVNSPSSISFDVPSMLAGTYAGYVVVRNPGLGDSAAQDLVIVAGPVPTNTFTAVATTPPDGELEIDEHRCWPNPIVGGNLGLARIGFHLKGHADHVTLKVYTRAWVCVGSADSGAVSAGWTHLPLPSAFTADAGAGTYYYVLSAERGGAKSAKHSVGKLAVLR